MTAAASGGLRVPLADAVRAHVRPGMHLHFASTPSRSNAAVREVARAFRGTAPRFAISSTGFHSMLHLLPLLGLGERLIGAFFGDHYPAPRPNALYARAGVRDAVEHWSLWSLVSALRAGAQGDAWAVNRTLAGTGIAEELAARGLYREVVDPAGASADRARDASAALGLVAALRPDVTFVHAAAGDDDGNVVASAPFSEGMWSALAARRGVIITVERAVPRGWVQRFADRVALPPHRVLAVCEEPLGAHPQLFHAAAELGIAGYRDDFAHYEWWRAAERDAPALARFCDQVLGAADAGAAYRAWAGLAPPSAAAAERARSEVLTSAPDLRIGAADLRISGPDLRVARTEEQPPLAHLPPEPARDAARAAGIDELIIAGARQIAARARAIGARVLFAGIGQAFFAARVAQGLLAADGLRIRVMVETGLYDVDCGPAGHGYLLAYDNVVRAGRLSSIDDVLGVLGGGADNRCLAVLGAAQIDRAGNLNSTRVGGRPLVGSGGACDIAATCEEAIAIARCQPGRLVERVEYLTSPGRAVRSVVTDRGTLVRAGAPTSMVWRSLNNGCTSWLLAALPPGAGNAATALVRLRRDCPWPLEAAPALAPSPAITEVEARMLAALDPDGIHRRRAA